MLLLAYAAGNLSPVHVLGMKLHLAALLFVVSGSLMISKTIRIPEP